MSEMQNPRESNRLSGMMPNSGDLFKDGRAEGHADHNRDRRRYAFDSKAWAKFVTMLEWWEDLEEPPRSGILYGVVHSQYFEYFCSAVIIANCVFTAYVADWNSQHLGQNKTSEMRIAELGFLIFYFAELVLRLTVHGIYFFANEDARWNWFDFCLVLLSIGDKIMSYTVDAASAGMNVGFVRIFRIMKLAKIFRTLRVMKVFKELAIILQSFVNCVTSLFWCLVTLAFIFYVFALVLLQGMTAHLEEAGRSMTEDEITEVKYYFGSLWQSMLTLYMATTGGDVYGSAYTVVKKGGEGYDAFYLFFTFFFTIAVFNILTGVFVEKAVAANSPDTETQIAEHRAQNAEIIEKLMEIVEYMDEDGDGFISLEDFQRHMSNEYSVAFFQLIGLEVRDANEFFEVLAALGCRQSGRIERQRFVEACFTVRGNASALDVQKQSLENLNVQKQLSTLESKILHRFDALEERMLENEFMASRREVSKYFADSPVQESAVICQVQEESSARWMHHTSKPGSKRQRSDDDDEPQQQEKVQEDARCGGRREDTASTFDFDSMLGRFQDEMVANILPHIVSSVCSLADQQFRGPPSFHTSGDASVVAQIRRCVDEAEGMSTGFDVHRVALGIVNLQKQLSSVESRMSDKLDKVEARMSQNKVMSSPCTFSECEQSPSCPPSMHRPSQPFLTSRSRSSDEEDRHVFNHTEDAVSRLDFDSMLDQLSDELGANIVPQIVASVDELVARIIPHIVSSVHHLAGQQTMGRLRAYSSGDPSADAPSGQLPGEGPQMPSTSGATQSEASGSLHTEEKIAMEVAFRDVAFHDPPRKTRSPFLDMMRQHAQQ